MPANQHPDAEPIVQDAEVDGQAAIPAFTFPFKPGAFAAKQAASYPSAGKSNHDKIPGRAPNGTRRSMGKR
ncbi:hypothetical protein SOM59_01110 [Pseudomonas coleopterorum]|uniref:hypothetical protein n=1 Tax=Pseudomonas coleopterorum TaxID=1605838 RepID=UPI002A6A8CAC|nr:hypothetical protein [Pseudomonas coleopterorum]MDY1015674.1 hypothetical protein [Pseudomonas coleopterorum]